MEYLGTNSIEFDWEMWSQFLILDKQPALSLDSLLTSHPIAVTITNPSEIAQQFDTITYSKGASILRMLEAYLNSQDSNYFASGLTKYLEGHSYSNALTSDLWFSLSLVSQDNKISELMDSWTRKMGYPFFNG